MAKQLKTYVVRCHEVGRPGRKLTVTVAAASRAEAADVAWDTYSDIDLIVDGVSRVRDAGTGEVAS